MKESDAKNELSMQMRHSMLLCNTLRDEIVNLRSQSSKNLAEYRMLIVRMTARGRVKTSMLTQHSRQPLIN